MNTIHMDKIRMAAFAGNFFIGMIPFTVCLLNTEKDGFLAKRYPWS